MKVVWLSRVNQSERSDQSKGELGGLPRRSFFEPIDSNMDISRSYAG